MVAGTTLVIGGTGKTGRRVAERLKARGLPIRIGSRSGTPSFDWEDPATWQASLQGIAAAYVTYYPDLAVPGASDAIRSFTDLAVKSGVSHLVLLSGRGEPEAQHCEEIVRKAGVDWTVLRASWFSQNFSENYLRELILSGEVVLPAGDIGEPFVDTDDIADVAVAALTEEGHSGQLYELTGPRLWTFAEATAEIGRVTRRDIRYVQVPIQDYTSALAREGLPLEVVSLMGYLFTEVLDGRNASIADGVKRALGREPRDFADFVRDAAATGVWNSGQADS